MAVTPTATEKSSPIYAEPPEDVHNVMHAVGEQAALAAVLQPKLAQRVGVQLPASRQPPRLRAVARVESWTGWLCAAPVQERLGHASRAITLDLYSHVAPGMQQDAAATVAALVGLD